MEIQYKGLNLLNESQKFDAQKIAESESEKLRLKNAKLFIDIKQQSQGKRKKFSIHMRILNPSIVMEAKQYDWDLHTALRKTFENLKNEETKKFKKKGIVRTSKDKKLL